MVFGRRRDDDMPHWQLPYRPVATEADIFHCFRLLLGRHPHREEWRGHAMQAGGNLDSVVAGYLGSLEFARRNLRTPDRTPEVTLAMLPEFRIYVAAADAAIGRHVREDNYEREVAAVFRRLLRPGMGVIDLGANIGYFSLLAATLVGAGGFVLAVEPNPRNASLLEASRRLNGFAQVTIAQVAAGPATGLLVLHTSHSNATTSDPPDDLAALLDAVTVPAVAVDSLLREGQRIDLVKADVEGAEYKALLGCAKTIARDRPVIVSEFSPDLMPGISGVTGPDYLQWLAAQNYRLAVIAPDGSLDAADDWPQVMAAYAAQDRDHIDIVAIPY
jgi:FkbM family methyltransferase